MDGNSEVTRTRPMWAKLLTFAIVVFAISAVVTLVEGIGWGTGLAAVVIAGCLVGAALDGLARVRR